MFSQYHAGVKTLTLILALTIAGCATTSNRPTVEEEIRQLERARQDAFVRNDIDLLDRATTADYTTINGSGKLSTKPQMMQNLRQGRNKVLSVELTDMKARIYGNTAVLTGDYRDVHVRDGVQSETHALFTRVFVKSHGQWESVAYQQTVVPAQ
jgi:hypothetical protein